MAGSDDECSISHQRDLYRQSQLCQHQRHDDIGVVPFGHLSFTQKPLLFEQRIMS